MQIGQPLFRGHGIQPAAGRLPPFAGLGHGVKLFRFGFHKSIPTDQKQNKNKESRKQKSKGKS
jgi:hypothetical protein